MTAWCEEKVCQSTFPAGVETSRYLTAGIVWNIWEGPIARSAILLCASDRRHWTICIHLLGQRGVYSMTTRLVWISLF